jgi:hypothetical protein
MLHEGAGHDAGDVRAYLRQRLANGQPSRPPKKPWRE